MADRVLECGPSAAGGRGVRRQRGGRLGPTRGALVVWEPGRGLNGAVEAGVDHLLAHGVTQVTVAHADLPRATDLALVGEAPGITLVPDRYGNGTNVIALPGRMRASSSPTVPARSPATGPRPSGSASPAGARPARSGLGHRRARPTWCRWRRRASPPGDSGPDDGRTAGVSGLPVGDLPTAGTDHRRPSRALERPGHRRPPRRHRVRVRRHPGQVGGGRLPSPPPGPHRRLQGQLGSRTPISPPWSPSAMDESPGRRRGHRRPFPTDRSGGDDRVLFLGRVDGELVNGVDERREVARIIRTLRPSVVLGHDPWRRYRLHPDHRAAGFLTLDALVAARDPHFFPELELAPHRPEGAAAVRGRPAQPCRGRAAVRRHKIDALLCHHSQWRVHHGHRPAGSPAASVGRRTGNVRPQGPPPAGRPRRAGRAQTAEAFHLITDL